ncbi:MAG: ATP-binding protein [Thermanaerothrix sp.]|nr:ATP-binding protein [Thermanaerothrix sp.]
MGNKAPCKKGGYGVIFVFKSHRDLISTRESILSVLRELNPSRALRIYVALNEAINNAFLHGKAPVTLRIEKDTKESGKGERLVMSVSCGGRGFIPTLGLPEDHMPNGRGLYLIRAMAGSVRFEDRGRRVVLECPMEQPPWATATSGGAKGSKNPRPGLSARRELT